MHAEPIIIVDDDQDDQQLIQDICRLYCPGKEVIVFDSGESLLSYLRTTKDQPFLILCDVNMPRMDGLRLRGEIVKDEFLREKSIPFIFLSTSANSYEVRTAYDLIVQGYFEKGASYDLLKRKLKLVLEYWQECKHPNFV